MEVRPPVSLPFSIKFLSFSSSRILGLGFELFGDVDKDYRNPSMTSPSTESLYLGFDIGGTTCSVCLGSPSGEILDNTRIATADLGGSDTGIPRLTEIANTLLQKNSLRPIDVQAIGISAPGPVDIKKTGASLNPQIYRAGITHPLLNNGKKPFSVRFT